MNILIFAHDSSLYGASQSLLTSLIGLAKKQDRKLLVLLPYKGDLEKYLTQNSIEYKIIPFPKCVVETKKDSFWKTLKAIYNYRKKVKRVFNDLNQIVNSFKPDVVYTNTSILSIGFYLSKKNNIPHVWHVREFSDFYEFQYLPNLKSFKNQLLKSKEIIFGSNALLNHWIKAQKTNSSVIYNGVFDDDKISYSERKVTNYAVSKRLGIVGAIIKGKGQHIAIEALAELHKNNPEVTLTIYGDIIDQDYFKILSSLIQKLGISGKVTFKGFADSKDEIYNSIDVLLSCSQMEGFGRTIVEAMGYGIPVIANATGGVLEIIEDTLNGILFDGTVSGLVLAINLLNDSEVFTNLAINGFNHAKEKYSVNKYIEQIDDVLRKAVKD